MTNEEIERLEVSYDSGDRLINSGAQRAFGIAL